MAKGSCVCGAVKYEVEKPFLAFQYCHCSRCRKGSGSGHAANLLVKPDQLTWLQGQDQVKTFYLPNTRYWGHAFCTECGSAMPMKSKTGRAWLVPAGALDDDPGERPTRNIYFASQASWAIDPADLASFDTYPS